MSDTVTFKVDVSLALLDQAQEHEIVSFLVKDVSITLPIDSTDWDEMSASDRDDAIQGHLWERCRTDIMHVRE